MNLEHRLRDIQTNRSNLDYGRLPQMIGSNDLLWHVDAVQGPSTSGVVDCGMRREKTLGRGDRLGPLRLATGTSCRGANAICLDYNPRVA